MSREAMRMNSVLLFCFSLGSFACPPGCPASVITQKISTRDPGIAILGSKLTRLARLSYSRKVDFCCIELRCWDLCKASQPGSCNQALSSIARFYSPNPPPPPPLDLRAFHQSFDNFLASSHFEQFMYSEQFLYYSFIPILRYRSSFQCLNWPCFHIIFHNVLVHNLCISCEKEPFPPPGADYGRKMYAAGLLGQRFF